MSGLGVVKSSLHLSARRSLVGYVRRACVCMAHPVPIRETVRDKGFKVLKLWLKKNPELERPARCALQRPQRIRRQVAGGCVW